MRMELIPGPLLSQDGLGPRLIKDQGRYSYYIPQIKRPFLLESKLERRMSKVNNAIISVEHPKSDSAPISELMNSEGLGLPSIFRCVHQLNKTFTRNDKVSGLVLQRVKLGGGINWFLLKRVKLGVSMVIQSLRVWI